VQTAELELTAGPPAVAGARRWVSSLCTAWGVEEVDAVTLLVSEVVTNAVRHGRGPVHLRLQHPESRVRVEVSDASTDLPERREADGCAEHGRGLLLLSELAQRWGVERRAQEGKTVWFEVADDPGQRLSPAG
jgi:anti-sigma regulatory factor (Ser/Thr protein kinase)